MNEAKINHFEEFLTGIFEKVSLDNFTVLKPKSKVLLCGGALLYEDEENKINPCSLRQVIFDYSQIKDIDFNKSFILPEHIDKYYEHYNDLLEFERDLADLCSVIVIILESPGSLVEFGIFSGLSDLYEKLLVVIDSNEIKEESFIVYGPVKYIKKYYEDNIYSLPFKDANRQEAFDYINGHWKHLSDEIKLRISKVSETKYRGDNFGHLLHLITEIIRIFYPIIFSDIIHILAVLKLNILEERIAKALFMLESLDYISKERYSNRDFYYPIKIDEIYLKFGKYKNGAFDSRKHLLNRRQLFIENDLHRQAFTTISKKIREKENENS